LEYSRPFLNIFTAVAGLVGAISVIMIVIAGIFYLTSAGSPEKMETAKKALTYAIIGMVVAVAAVTIVDTVLWVIGAQ
jgi:NAD/NADP transhydrogenase beta subunit